MSICSVNTLRFHTQTELNNENEPVSDREDPVVYISYVLFIHSHTTLYHCISPSPSPIPNHNPPIHTTGYPLHVFTFISL